MAGCQPQPVTPGKFSFDNWSRGDTGRLKYVGKVYSPDGVKLAEFANVPVKSDGSFSYSLRTPSANELNAFDTNSILATCKITDKTTKTITGEAVLTLDGKSTKYNVTIANKSPEKAYDSGTKVITEAVYVSKPVKITGTCSNLVGEPLKSDVDWSGGKWNFSGYNGNTIYGREKLGDPDLKAYIAQISTLSTQSVGRRAIVKPLKFVR